MKAARFYARFGIMEEQLRRGVLSLEEIDSTPLALPDGG